MALFRLNLCWCVDIGFRSITFAEMHCFLLKDCSRIYQCKIQVKFDISNHPQSFDRVMALFRLRFCSWSKLQGKDIVSPQKLLTGCIDFIRSLQNGISL